MNTINDIFNISGRTKHTAEISRSSSSVGQDDSRTQAPRTCCGSEYKKILCSEESTGISRRLCAFGAEKYMCAIKAKSYLPA